MAYGRRQKVRCCVNASFVLLNFAGFCLRYFPLALLLYLPFEQITVSAVCGEVAVKDTDMTILLANAMENAITGAQEYRAQTRLEPDIDVVIGIIQNNFAVQLTNSCAAAQYAPHVPEKSKGTFLPASAYLSVHRNGGQGLKRIDYIVEKYGGFASFRFDEAASLWTARLSLVIRKGRL